MPGTRTPGGRIVPQGKQPKLCAKCLSVCAMVNGKWECPKHGVIENQ